MRTILLCSMLLASMALIAQETRIEKDYSESYSIDGLRLVEVNNKYGDVIVNTWQKDSVRIVVNVEAFGKSQDLIDREIRRVDVQLRRVGSMVTGVTKFDQGKTKGIFGELLAELEDVSKTIVGNSKLTVNYELWMPSELELKIENKFGDIYIGQINGDMNIDLSHGDLRGDRFGGKLNLQHSFGKHTIDQVNEGDLTLRGVTSDISMANRLTFESGSSEIFLDKVDHLRLDNRNDKVYVEEAQTITGEGSFTDLSVKKVATITRLNFTYGEIFLDQILSNFEQVRIEGKSCDINLIINQGSYIKTYIEGSESRMILPNSMLTMSKSDIEDSEKVRLSGMVGHTQTEVSDLYIIADNGDLIISIEETDMFTNKK
jgi:hypothetical protein